MKATILLNYSENTKQIENEEKTRYIKTLLEQMGVPIQEFWTDEDTLSIDQKIKLRNLFKIYNIKIIDDLDGDLQIYVDGDKIAEWFKPVYKLKRDLSELDVRKQLYLEMEIRCWSLFEDSEALE